MAFLWFFIGLLLGGCEDEIRELRAKLNNH